MPDPIVPASNQEAQPRRSDEEVQSSILLSVKSALGVEPDFTPFDNELCMFINSVMAECEQLGLGPDPHLRVTGPEQTWDEFNVGNYDGETFDLVKSYVYKRVKILFDPPQPSVISAYQDMIKEDQWRMRVKGDEMRSEVEDDG